MQSFLNVIQQKRRQNCRRSQIPAKIRIIASCRSWHECSRNRQIWIIPGHGTISNCDGVQPIQVEIAIQGSIVSTSPPNSQEVTRIEEEVTPVRAESRSSGQIGQWQNSSTMRMTLRIISTMNKSNDGIGKKERPTMTPPNREITVGKKNGVREYIRHCI